MAKEFEGFHGDVLAIIYQNAQNGYSVIKMRHGNKSHTVVGKMPTITVGETLEVQGFWMEHPTYGTQLQAQIVQRQAPETNSEILRFLSSGAIKGVGKTTARNLVDTFGGDLLDILENDPSQLMKVSGITKNRAEKIHKSYCSQMGTRRLFTFLSTHELPLSLVPTLTKYYGEQALDMILANPYLLTGEGFSLKFAEAERVASALAFHKDSIHRYEAGILFILHRQMNQGHSFVPKDKLQLMTSDLLRCPYVNLLPAFDNLEDRGKLIYHFILEEEMVYLPSLYDAETEVSIRMKEMTYATLLAPRNLDKIIKSIQKSQNLTYSPEQCSAVEMAATQQIMLLTGGPGTGKTTSLRGVLALFDALHLHTFLAAPTGRAAQRLSELCGREASTIHRLLEAGFDSASGDLVFQRNSDDPLEVDAVIVDETSMVDILLMSHLIRALPNHCRLILVGDPDQLPSVGAGNVYADLISSQLIPMVRLSQIFRQAQESLIVRNAHFVNQGIVPDLSQKNGDFFFIPRKTSRQTLETIVDLCERRLPSKMGVSLEQIQVLSPTRLHGTGTASLNLALQSALNPPDKKKSERNFGSWTFRVKDRVMQVKNNYDISWRDGTKEGEGIFNGDIGEVIAVNPNMVRVSFDGKEVEYTTNLLPQLEPAYAVTVHKSQGSEYHAVIFAAFDGAKMLLNRCLLYTAITRAKHLFIVVGDQEVLNTMISQTEQIHRYSGLRFRLIEDDDA